MKKAKAAVAEAWYRAIFTDRNGEFDTGRVLVAVTIIGMLGLAWLDVDHNKAHFDTQAFGIGIGAVLAGFAAYLATDKKPEPPK